MQLCPYLHFNGQCEAAFKYYAQHLGGKIAFKLTWAETPMAGQVPAEWASKLIHATLMVGDKRLQGTDAAPGQYEKPKGFSVSLSPTNLADAERIFAALAKNGTVIMALQKTFWSAGFGMVTDQFGIPWMVNCEQPGSP